MRWQRVMVSMAMVVLVACASDEAAPDLPMLAGKIVWATAMHPENCTPGRCQATFQLEIRNMTEADAAVTSCRLAHANDAIEQIPVSEGVPIVVRSGSTQLVRASSLLPVSPRRLRRLGGVRIRCPDVVADAT